MSAGVQQVNGVFTCMEQRTQYRPGPNPRHTMPTHWPPRQESRVGNHFRAYLATYVLCGLAVVIVGGGIALGVVISRLSEIRAIVAAR